MWGPCYRIIRGSSKTEKSVQESSSEYKDETGGCPSDL
jgi:hypothetical protein